MSVVITRLYDTSDDGKRAVAALESAGVPSSDIGILSNNAEDWFSASGNTAKVTEGAATGVGIGAGIGSVAGLLAGLGMLAVPGLGPVVAAGWLAATAVGAAAGAATGGLLGTLTAAGISDTDAQFFAEGVRRGGTVVSARVPETDAPRLDSVLAHAAVDAVVRQAAWEKAGWQKFDAQGVPLTADEIRRERGLYRR